MGRSRLLFYLVSLLVSATSDYHNTSRRVCDLKGIVDDCVCDVETTNRLNAVHIYPKLKRLLERDYFRYFKVDLTKSCLFWPDDGRCVLRDCSVESCPIDELPRGLVDDGYDCEHNNEKQFLSEVDQSVSEREQVAFATWDNHDDAAPENFCELDDERSDATLYVDLLKNPERYTGYAGASPRRVWRSIYEENCFPNGRPKVYSRFTPSGLCREERVFYRAISGLHSSINIHLCAKYFHKGAGPFSKPTWSPNLSEFKRRFDSEMTRGRGPGWLKNLYMIYLLSLRAIVKAGSYLEKETFYTGNDEEDRRVKEDVLQLIESARSCPGTFDESDMFRGESASLKEEFRLHFRNISRIMDCVGCDKCKLWGKLQTLGIGTGLKILFSWELDQSRNVTQRFQLRRNEIVALFNVLGRFSSSINALKTFRKLEEEEEKGST
ncbi:ERO1-like protein beta isoform X2 [Oscarella lobularis]|uniref:ERO1-like protein beta isoform X2 n=1 Tax=Oscarella lobularis TaxID=121494 RepID=UPI003313769E